MEDQFESEMDYFDDEGYALYHFMETLRQQDLVIELPEVVVPTEVFAQIGTEYGHGEVDEAILGEYQAMTSFPSWMR